MCFSMALQLKDEVEPFIVGGLNLDEILKEVEGRVGAKRETVADLMGMSLGQLSNQIHGQGHLDMLRFLNLAFHVDPMGRSVVLSFLNVVMSRFLVYELDEVAEAALTVAVALRDKLRMARAALVDRTALGRRRA